MPDRAITFVVSANTCHDAYKVVINDGFEIDMYDAVTGIVVKHIRDGGEQITSDSPWGNISKSHTIFFETGTNDDRK